MGTRWSDRTADLRTCCRVRIKSARGFQKTAERSGTAERRRGHPGGGVRPGLAQGKGNIANVHLDFLILLNSQTSLYSNRNLMAAIGANFV